MSCQEGNQHVIHIAHESLLQDTHIHSFKSAYLVYCLWPDDDSFEKLGCC